MLITVIAQYMSNTDVWGPTGVLILWAITHTLVVQVLGHVENF